MRHGHGADSCITARVCEQLFEVVDLPNRYYTSISTCQHILTITAEKHGLQKGIREKSNYYFNDYLFNFLLLECYTTYLALTVINRPDLVIVYQAKNSVTARLIWSYVYSPSILKKGREKKKSKKAIQPGPTCINCLRIRPVIWGQFISYVKVKLIVQGHVIWQKSLGQRRHPQGLSEHRPWLATEMAPHSETRRFTCLICFSSKV